MSPEEMGARLARVETQISALLDERRDVREEIKALHAKFDRSEDRRRAEQAQRDDVERAGRRFFLTIMIAFSGVLITAIGILFSVLGQG